MSSLSNRLRLIRWASGDKFKNADLVANWNALDAAPGTHICTSASRPSDWTANQAGRFIFETDTRRIYQWTGSAWQSEFGRGARARAERLTVASTTAFSYSAVVSAPSTVYSDRRHLIVVEAPKVYSSAGVTGLAIFRDGTLLQEWNHRGGTGAAATDVARGMSFVTTDQQSSGTAVVYSLQMTAVVGYGGTCYVEGATNKPCAITVVEV